MSKVIKRTESNAPQDQYSKPWEQTIECSDTETFNNGLPCPIGSFVKWSDTIEAMDDSGILEMSSGYKFELV